MRWRRRSPISIQAWGQRFTLNCLRHAALVSRSWYLSSSKSGSPEVGPPAGFVGLSQLQMSKVFGIGVGMNTLESFHWAVLAQRFTFIILMPSTHSWSSRVWTESEKQKAHSQGHLGYPFIWMWLLHEVQECALASGCWEVWMSQGLQAAWDVAMWTNGLFGLFPLVKGGEELEWPGVLYTVSATAVFMPFSWEHSPDFKKTSIWKIDAPCSLLCYS